MEIRNRVGIFIGFNVEYSTDLKEKITSDLKPCDKFFFIHQKKKDIMNLRIKKSRETCEEIRNINFYISINNEN